MPSLHYQSSQILRAAITFSLLKISYSLSTTTSHPIKIQPIQEIQSIEFNPYLHYFHKKQYETPVLIKNVLNIEECESICDTIYQHSSDYHVDLQCKKRHKKETKTEILQCTLRDAFDYMMESQHSQSYFSFCEGLLDETTNESILKIQNVLHQAKEHLFHSNDDDDDENEDLFQYFPSKPTDCLILAGEGATSTLHRDPFEWTGTSICLEGTKIWRFISPPLDGVGCIDDLLKAYTLPSMAWSEDDINLSVGYQSDLSLYDYRGEKVPSAEEFHFMEEKQGLAEKHKVLNSISEDINVLRPCQEILNHLSDKQYKLHSIVQKPGDLLIIPAYWYHQTYALEPSLAIASQRCGLDRDLGRVVSHILRYAWGYDDLQCEAYLSSRKHMGGREIVDDLFDYIGNQLKI